MSKQEDTFLEALEMDDFNLDINLDDIDLSLDNIDLDFNNVDLDKCYNRN